MSDLPKGWIAPTIEEIGIAKTKSVNPALTPAKHFELWSVPSFPTNEPEIITGGEIKSNKASVQPNDVLLCKINPRINRVWVVRPTKKELPQIASSEWIVVRNEQIDSHYLRYAFIEDSFRIKLCSNVSGVGGSLTRARPQDVRRYRINIAPPEEQKRIVKKLDTCQGHIDRSKSALDAIPQLLEDYRASLLAKAFNGELTADWRAQQKAQGIKHESAEELLQRLRQERRKQWEKSELAKYQAKGKTPPKKWKNRFKESISPDFKKSPNKLPTNWLWTSVSDQTLCLDSQRIPISKNDRVTGPYPYYGANGQVDFVSKYLFDEHLTLVTEDETFYGRTAPIAYSVDHKCWVNNHAHVLRPLPPISNSYITHMLMHYDVEPWLSGTTGRAKLTQAALNCLPIPLAPIPEQKEIIRLLEMAFKRINAIKDLHAQLKSQHSKLTQSILAKAFRGELVPQTS
ncbi:restriction endonuclease subunit S [Verrucomicrobiaceae bacterium 5K15]|uniref:Restriction endonuclease subunit S n=1 Tax=Oceaniferula flava TaxID=2800421 RepID=A0AAE2SBU2_9BACT|nr:restriction endonuclease subunit S [Oceaniferula flavus]MBK1854993.1 restriction endonuclease subunit S [Oceaniferula flavus]MBM1136299.1 restriction endonuclease subunit S [Oceaniferula flavus]